MSGRTSAIFSAVGAPWLRPLNTPHRRIPQVAVEVVHLELLVSSRALCSLQARARRFARPTTIGAGVKLNARMVMCMGVTSVSPALSKRVLCLILAVSTMRLSMVHLCAVTLDLPGGPMTSMGRPPSPPLPRRS